MSPSKDKCSETLRDYLGGIVYILIMVDRHSRRNLNLGKGVVILVMTPVATRVISPFVKHGKHKNKINCVSKNI